MKKIINSIIIFLSILLLCFISITAVHLIPNEKAILHINESISQLESEGLYPRMYFNKPSTQLDNFTDSIMLNIAASGNSNKPIYSAMNSSVTINTSVEEPSPIDNLSAFKNLEESKKGSYSRYWHGYILFLKPLLTFFTYEEIRFLNMCIMMTLFTITSILLNKELGFKYTLCFLGTMMFVMFPIIPMSLQFSSVFYIMLLSMIYILLRYRKIYETKNSIYTFLIIGCMTSFIDFLTAPLITLGIPLILYLALCTEKIDISYKNVFYELIMNCILWCFGYLSMWASKWILGSFVLRENILKNAMLQASFRTSSSLPNGDKITLLRVLILNFETILSFLPKVVILGSVITIFIFSFIFRKKTNKIMNTIPTLLIGIFPILWYILLTNHSTIHYWFTFRNLSITIFAFSISLASCTKFK